MQDLRYALRMLGKNPGFTFIAILTLALGIGANTAMFTVINGVLLEPLPYKDPDRLMVITERDEKRNQVQPYSLSWLNFQDWAREQRSFSDLALFRVAGQYNSLRQGFRELMTVRQVSANLLPMLGVAPVVGRGFTPDDDRLGASPTIILTYGGWQRLFTGFNATVNETVSLNGESYHVIGVLPRGFQFGTIDLSQPVDGFMPIGLVSESWMTMPERRPGIAALGRLKPGVTQVQAQAQLQGIARELAVLYPDANENRGAAVTRLFDAVVDEDIRTTLYLLFATVGFVLLIACGNVANLLLARGTARQKEIAIRSALGAARGRIARQLLMESVILATAAGAAGLVVAIAGTDLLAVAGPLPRVAAINVDWRVLAFSFAVSLLTGVLFGLAPLLQSLRSDVQASLKEGGTSSGRGRYTPQKLLVVGEVALAVVLLLGAGLVLRSTLNAINVDPGFEPQNVASFRVVMSAKEFPTGQSVHSFYRRLEDRLRLTPGVQAASLTLGGMPKPVGVNKDYLRLMGIRLLQGRFFGEQDTLSAPPVIVIDELLAKARFPGENPLGKPFVIDLPGTPPRGLEVPRQVVGVVNHVKRFGIETEDQIVVQAQFYIPAEQVPDELFESGNAGFRMFVKYSLPDREMFPALSEAVRHVDPKAYNPGITATGFLNMENGIRQALAPRRFVARLLGAFAVIGFILAAVGIYGVMAYSVSERRQEIGIRMALGAEVPYLVKMVLRQAGVLAVSGIVLGLVVSFWLTKYISYLLFEITPTDPMTYTTVAALLFVVALAAAYVPARRAMALEPMTALRGMDERGLKPATTFREESGPQNVVAGFSPRSEAIIEVRDIQKIFRTVRGKSTPALGGVSLAVEPATIFGLIGQNGAGKTTLVKIFLGLCKPTSGYARLLGCSPGEPVAQRKIGYLPESMRIPDHFMPENFLRYMGRLNRVDAVLLEKRIPELLEKVGLAEARKPVKSFSKGMQQRLGIAQALINDPEVLFLDEPTDGLDPLGRIEIRDLLAQLRDAGKTVFLNSHLLSEVELVCDQIVILDKGIVARTTTPSEFTRGTGEYVVRLQTINDTVRQVTQSIVGPAEWHGDTIRFTPRDVAHLNDFLDALRRVPVAIVAVEPIKLSLEQFFIQVVTDKER